ncbi:MAG: flippase-like domain-containing protein [Bacteroidetes bacterium]|nr:flippase-like domain-containing protein [Bacteroidota bacterium]
MFSTIAPAEVINVLSNVLPSWVVFFLFFSITQSVYRTWRYQLLLTATGYRTSNTGLFLITLVRNFFSDLLPARLGTLIYVYLIQSRLHIPLAPALSSFAYSFIFDIFSLSLLILVAIVVTTIGEYSNIVIFMGGISLGITSLAVLFILPKCSRLASKVSNKLSIFPKKWRQRLHDEFLNIEHYLLLSKKHGIFWKTLALSLGVRFCKYLSLYVLLIGFVIPLGYQLADFPLPKVFLGLCSAELAASLPISGIAGFGAYEGAWALVFQLLGYPERIAMLTGVSHHLFTQVYGYSIGGIALLLLVLPLFQKSRKKREVEKEKGEGGGFWGRFVISVTFILLVAYLLAPTKNDGRIDVKVNGDGVYQNDQQQNKSVYTINNLPGKVVYERLGGIFVTDLATMQEDQIVISGSYPRWSPDGQSIAYTQGNGIILFNMNDGKSRKIAQAHQARAVCFGQNGKSILFTDGKRVRRVDIVSREVTDVLHGGTFREIDISRDGKILATTVKSAIGFNVRIYAYPKFIGRTVAKGCSASLSPDGLLVTVNGRHHKKIHLFDTVSLLESSQVQAPEGNHFDNQFWSNHPDWMVSTSEGANNDIFIHHVRDGSSRKVTSSGDCDRADLFVPMTPY